MRFRLLRMTELRSERPGNDTTVTCKNVGCETTHRLDELLLRADEFDVVRCSNCDEPLLEVTER